MADMTTFTESSIFDNPQALAREIAEWLCALAHASDRDFAICLCGGSTPRRLYERLADPDVASRFPWSRVHWFWGDERFVPHNDPDSNYRMVCDTLLSRVPVQPGNIHAISTQDMEPEQAAAMYEAMLKRFYGGETFDPNRPLFDVTLLGIGEDGHTASLFPGHPALAETHAWVLAVQGPMPEPRITLTLPVLNSSRNVAFLAVGERKREIVARAQAGDWALPAARVRPVGPLHWFLDQAAAADRPFKP